MRYRTAKLLAEESIAAAGTKTIDINVTDMISRIVVAYRTSKSKNGMDSYAHKDVSRIELVDGSEILHSLSGGQNQALCIYDRKVGTMSHGQRIDGSSEYNVYGIDFGRFLLDPVLAFDPTKFNNPQLKITHNFAVSDTGVTAGLLEVWAECFDERKITPIGFLAAKEVYAYTCGAAASYEYIDLPVDRALRKLLIEGYRSGYSPWDQIIEARLDEDNEKRIPFDWDLEDYNRVKKGEFEPVEEVLIGIASAGGLVFYVTPTDYWATLAPISQNNAPDLYISGASMTGGKATLKSAAATQFTAIVRGWLPNHCFCFPFGDQMDMEDWYNVANLGSLRLRLKAGGSAANGTGAAIVQQLRKYGG